MNRDLKSQAPTLEQLLRHAAWTRQLARGLVANDALADDAAQETLLSALKRPPHTAEPLKPWLRTVVSRHVYNQARERKRRDARESRLEVPEAVASADELLDRLELHRILVETVGQLAEPYRQTVLLRYFEELSSAEIAARVDLPAATVRGRLKTAVELLREALDARYGARAVWVGPIGKLFDPRATPGRPPARRGAPASELAPQVASRAPWVAAAAVLVAAAVGTTWGVAHHRAGRSAVAAREVAYSDDVTVPAPREKPGGTATVAQSRTSGGGAAGRALRDRSGGGSSRVGALPDVHGITGSVTIAESVAAKARFGRRIGAQGGLAGVAVRIAAGAPAFAAGPTGPFVVAVSDLRFPPSIRFSQAGQELVVENRDVVPHSVALWRGPTKVADELIPAGGRSSAVTTSEPMRFAAAEQPRDVEIVVPSDNPFHAVTDENGRFDIHGLSPGTYTVEAWDADLGAVTGEATTSVIGGPPLLLAFGSGPAATGSAPGPASGSCRIAEVGRGPVGSACASGGVQAARKLMKDMVKQAKAKGEKFTCDGCHKDLDTLALTKNAREDFDKLLAQVGRK